VGGIVACRRILFRQPSSRSNGAVCSARAVPGTGTNADARARTVGCAGTDARAGAGARSYGNSAISYVIAVGGWREAGRRFSRLSGLR
jgi:hypothetical protein